MTVRREICRITSEIEISICTIEIYRRYRGGKASRPRCVGDCAKSGRQAAAAHVCRGLREVRQTSSRCTCVSGTARSPGSLQSRQHRQAAAAGSATQRRRQVCAATRTKGRMRVRWQTWSCAKSAQQHGPRSQTRTRVVRWQTSSKRREPKRQHRQAGHEKGHACALVQDTRKER